MHSYYIVIDLESTCDENQRQIPRDEMEVIELGAVLVDSALRPVWEFSQFIKPVRHPKLTPFCTQLTTITQAQVDNGVDFPEALDALVSQLPEDYLFCSWGAYDRNQLEQDCRFHGVPYPLKNHFNVKVGFSNKQRCRGLGVTKALGKMSLNFEGTHHRGVDDARNIARLLKYSL